jgi:hypothetical protein
MSTKVISAKVSEEEYDKLLQSCNEKGCTVSQFVKDSCNKLMNDTPEQDPIPPQKPQDDIISKLDENIARLQLALELANSNLQEKTLKLKEYSEFVDPIAFNYWKSKQRK